MRPISADTRSETVTKLPGILVIHENRGLNPHIEDIARRFALANFMAFAPDGLTSLGGYPGDDYKGGQMFSKIDKEQDVRRYGGRGDVVEGASRLHGKDRRHRLLLRGPTANMLAVRLGADLAAAVPFYGGPPATEDIPKIKAAILVHHGELDTRLAATWPAYDQALSAATFRTKAISTLAPFMASIAMRRRNATTKPQPISPGSARSTGSTNTRAASGGMARHRSNPSSTGGSLRTVGLQTMSILKDREDESIPTNAFMISNRVA